MASTGIIYKLIAVDAASRTFHRIGRAAAGADTTLGKLGATAKMTGTLLGEGLAVALGESAKEASRFQSEMTRVSTQAGASMKDVKELSAQVLKLGTVTQQGPDALAESLYHLKSVGMDNASAMKALKQSADLAAVGHADLEETTNALAGAWRTGIRGATSFHEAVSTVNAIIGAGNMKMEDFNAAIGTGILPSAKEFGLSMKQVGAALALMTDEGIDSASAATRLRMSFSLLGAPSGAAEKQLKKIGLTGLDLAKAMRSKDGLIGAIQLLKDHLDKSGMSAAEQSQLLSRAFGGGRSSSGILLMLNNLDVLKKKQDQVNRSTGRFDDAVKQQRKTAEAQWHLLTSNLEVMSVRIGTKVLPPITDFVHFLATDAMPAAARFGQVIEEIIPVDKIKSSVGEAKSTIDGFLSGLTGGKSVGTAVGDFMDGLTGAGARKKKTPAKPSSPPLMLTVPQPPPLLAKPHKAVTPALKTPAVPRALARPKSLAAPPIFKPKTDPGLLARRKAVTPPKSAAENIGTQIHDAISGGIKDIDWNSLGPLIGGGLGSAFQWLVAHGTEMADKLGKAIGGIDWVNVGKQLGVIALPFAIGFIDNLFEPMFHVDFWKKHWLDTIIAVISVIPMGRMGGALSKLGGRVPWSRFGSALRRIPWGKLIPFSEKLAQALGPLIRSVTEFVATLGWHMIQAFARRFPRVAAWFGRELALLPTRLGVLALDMGSKAADLVRALGKGLLDHLPGSSSKWIRGVYKWFGRYSLYQIGLNLAKSMLSGMWSLMKDVGSWLKRHMVDPVVHGVKALFGIHSPSTVFMSIGRNLVSGLKSGILDAAGNIGRWIGSHIVSPVTSRFTHAGSWLTSKGSALVSGLKSGISGGASGIGRWLGSHVVSPVTSRFAHAGSWLRGAGGSLLSGLKGGMSGAMKGISGWIRDTVVNPVVSAVKHFFGIKSPSRVFMSIGGHLVSGLIKGMARTNGTTIAKRVFGTLPKALAALVKKGLLSITSLPGKALKALGGLGGDLLGLLGLGGGGGGASGANQKIGATLAAAHGWVGPYWAALKSLWNGESGWNERALNKSSGAYGIPQALPASKMASAGGDWKTNPATQIKWGLGYIASRYGDPIKAYSAWLSRSPHWYAKGTRGGAAPGLAWVGEQGPELVNFKGGEDVISHPQSMAFAKAHGIKLPGYASGTIENAADREHRARQKVEDAKDAVARAKRRHKGIAAAEKKLRAAEKELQAAEISLKNAKRSAKTQIANTIATGLLKTLQTGTSSAIGSAIKSIATKLLNAGYDRTAKSVQKKGASLQALADQRASIQKKIADATQYATDQASNIKDFLSISGTSATSVRDLISQMGSQQKTASSFVALSKSLRARGASKDLLEQLAEAGPGSQLATILGQKNVTTMDIAKLNKLASSGNKLATSFGKAMADLMYDSGKHAGEGFLAGLKAQEKALQKQIDKLATDLVTAIKKALKIKSPSVVMRDEVGKNVVLGLAHGIDMHSHLVGAASQRLADTATGVSLRRRYVPTAARNAAGSDEVWERLAVALEDRSSQPQHLTGELVLDSGELLGVIQGTVKPMIKSSEDRQAFRARVGRR